MEIKTCPKNKIAAAGLALFILFLFGIPFYSTPGNPLSTRTASAQVKMLDKKLEEKQKAERGMEKKSAEGPAMADQDTEEPREVQLPKQTAGISPETFRMIEMIEKKNKELKKREAELRVKEQQLKTLESKIREDLDKINRALAKSEEQMGIQKELARENIDALVKVYSSMKPEEAAALIEAIDESLALQILSGMKSKIAGQVMSRLDVKVAKNLTEKMAGKTKPESTP